MDIGDVSKKSGVSASTLRYYEELGLITSTDRHGLRRQYPANILEILALISLAKLADFRLSEVGSLFKIIDGKTQISRSELKRKSAEIAKKIKQLEAARSGLSHAAECKAPSHMECPKFIRLLKLATKTQIRSKKN